MTIEKRGSNVVQDAVLTRLALHNNLISNSPPVVRTLNVWLIFLHKVSSYDINAAMQGERNIYSGKGELPSREDLFAWLERKPGSVDTLRKWNTTAITLFQGGQISMQDLGAFSVGFANKTDVAIGELRRLQINSSLLETSKVTLLELQSLGEECRTRAFLIAALEQSQTTPQQELDKLLSHNQSYIVTFEEPTQ